MSGFAKHLRLVLVGVTVAAGALSAALGVYLYGWPVPYDTPSGAMVYTSAVALAVFVILQTIHEYQRLDQSEAIANLWSANNDD